MFVLVVCAMAMFVVVVTMRAAKEKDQYASAARATIAPDTGSAIQPAVGISSDVGGSGAVASATTIQANLNRRLAIALLPVLRLAAGHIAVGVIDKTTGLRAIYNGRRLFLAASIVKADILAALLLRHQDARTPLTWPQAEMATVMIENSDDYAASYLWNAAGGAAGIVAANSALRLTHTSPSEAGSWGTTSTTVTDQLRLLTDLTGAKSPLSAAARDYVLGLMTSVEADQRWGVPAAAGPGSRYAVKDGWLASAGAWVVNSIGVVRRDRQELLIAVLADGEPTKAAGVAVDRAAAVAAARAITRPLS
jgi:beta-lactamase class A